MLKRYVPVYAARAIKRRRPWDASLVSRYISAAPIHANKKMATGIFR
jgi:hypothetical protein